MAQVDTKFKKGLIPWNKDKKGVQISWRKGLKLSPLSKKHRNKISLAMIGRVCSEETKKKISKANMGKKRTDEFRFHISKVLKGRKLSIEHKNKIKENVLKGENHPYWVKDRTLLINRDRSTINEINYRNWRWIVFERDKFKCKITDHNCKSQLEAHHILTWKDYPELRYDINNGITLCHYHHPHKRDEVERLIPIFKSLVEVI